MNVTLDDIKSALGITGSNLDTTLQVYVDEVIDFLVDAGVAQCNITSGVVARGVADLWNYGSGEGKLSQYFVQRAIQLSKKKGNKSSSGGGSSPDLSNYYTKMETDALLYLKANVADVYNKNDIDTALEGKADVADLDNKQDRTEETLETTNKEIPNAINEVNSIAKGAQKGISYGDYETMITAFNVLSGTVYNVGQSVYIVTLDVPDLWISDIESGNVPYTYIDDETFVNALKTDGYVQVGFYKLSALETGKVDLTEYYDKTETDDLLAPKLTEPSSNLAVGKWFRVASIDNDGHAVLECVDAPTAPIQSIATATATLTPDVNGKVTIPTALNGKQGTIEINGNDPFNTVGGWLILKNPTTNKISGRSASNAWAITQSTYDYAVKCAMTDGIGAAWTDAERLAALLRMGCTVDENGFVKFTYQE